MYEKTPGPVKEPTIDKVVSVIIPCYKQAFFLKEAIESVLAQTYPYFEILVVDDGSPDNVEEVSKSCPSVHYIKQSNSGAAIARNNGLWKSKGSFLVFLDADDRLLPNALEDGVNFLTSHPDCAFVTGLVNIIDSEGHYVSTPPQSAIEKNHFDVLLQSNYIWTPGVVMYRRDVFNHIHGFDSHAGGSADYELNIRIARTHPIGSHGKVVLDYRQHGANMSENLAYMLKSGVRVRKAQYPFIKHNPLFISSWKIGIQTIQDDVGRRLLQQIRQKIAGKASRKGLLTDLWAILKYYPMGLLRLVKLKIKEKIKLTRNDN
jgi:glycosyltransferase involved in cell wall biosynthesis